MFKGPIARATIRTSFVLGLRLVVQAGTLLLVARMLGPEQFGAFAGIAALALIQGTLSTFGTQWVLLDEVSKKASQREYVLSYAIPVTLLCGCCLLIIYLLLSNWILTNIQIPLSTLLAIGMAEIIFQPLLALVASEQHGRGNIAKAQLLHIFPMALRLLIAGMIIMLDSTCALVIYAMGYVASSIVALTLGLMTLPAFWPSYKYWKLPSKQELIKSSGYAVINITKSAPAEIDKTLALKLLPLGAAGLYAIGARVIGAITLPVIAMLLAALPRLFKNKHGKDTSELIVYMYFGAFFYSFLLSIIVWFSAPAFDLLFGQKFQGISETIQLLCFAVPAIALRLIAGNTLMALGSPWMRAGFEMLGILLLISLSVVLSAQFEFTGLPLAVVFSEWAMAIIGGFLTYYTLRKPFSESV